MASMDEEAENREFWQRGRDSMIEWGSKSSCNDKFDAEEGKSQTNQELYLDDEDVQTTWKNIYFQRKSKTMRKS